MNAVLWTLIFLMAAPFWEAKTPADWTDQELQGILTDSPWAQMVNGAGTAQPPPPVQVFLATAKPIEQAQEELHRRARLRRGAGQSSQEDDPLALEYRAWLEENRAAQIVLAIRVSPGNGAFSDEREVKRMEDESIMRIGRRKFKMTGHFPPYEGDPYLRLAFPRPALPGGIRFSDKTISFDLYLPGVPGPFRTAEFSIKDMMLKGKLEM